MDKARDRRETRGSRKKFSKGEGGAKGPVRLLKARGSAELRKVSLALLCRTFGWETEKCDLR